MDYYSHIRSDKKERLITHLKETADLAAFFASEFNEEKVAEQIGLLHDLGKHTGKFQRVLKGTAFHIDHAAVGAEYYWKHYWEDADPEIPDDQLLAQIICNCINSHHSDLHGDLTDDAAYDEAYCALPTSFDRENPFYTDNGKENALGSAEEFSAIEQYVAEHGLLRSIKETDFPVPEGMSDEAIMMFERMIFSCLVDADYSTTSSFYDGSDYRDFRRPKILQPEECLRKLQQYRKSRGYGCDDTGMNRLRNRVYQQCKEAGQNLSPGFYTLTAPTGSGKTHALIEFALEQSKRNGQRRIFVVLPYLSIIRQNAKEYQTIFGEDVCLEQDSLMEVPDELRLLSERWDYPMIVTTSVNFLETLCGSRASRERRLHQIANAVIVFDEVQTMPSDLLDVTLNTLASLPEYFHTTVLFSTATQPEYHFRHKLRSLQYQEIISDVQELYQDYGRIRKMEVMADVDRKENYDDLARTYTDRQQLFVFNTTRKAQKMYQLLCESYGDQASFLLSSALCTKHKSDVIKEIQRRLQCGEDCFVSSTQCIEAGVDLDFPAGMRECAPFPSIVQTAGRINRNGRGIGRMKVFFLDAEDSGGYPGVTYRNESYVAKNVIKKMRCDLNNPDTMKEYYRQIYSGDSDESGDRKEIRDAVDQRDTKELAAHYHLIEDQSELNVIVPYTSAEDKEEMFEIMHERIAARDYCIYKSELRECSGITVRIYGNKKTLEFLDRHCRRLKMKSGESVVEELTNWFIVEDKEIYDKKQGLIKEEKEGGFLY